MSEGAIRKRVARDTLAHDKAPDGRVYVYLDAGDTRGADTGQDQGVHPESSALISQLRDEISYLRDENRRKDEIIMQQALTVRQLAASPSTEDSQETSEPPESAARPSNTAETRSATEEQQEPTSQPRNEQQRSWWRRFFGFG